MAARGGGDSTGESISNAIAAVISAASPLSITSNGEVIVTAVVNVNGAYVITNQMTQGKLKYVSKIGQLSAPNVVTMPSPATSPGALPQPNQTTYVAEIYYEFKPTTPIGQLIHGSALTNLYDVAYF